jgi:hypothetical protein
MRKIMFMFFAAVVCMSFLSVSFAGDMAGSKGDKKWDKKDCKEDMGCKMCHMNKTMMDEKKLVATQDGGIVLMMYNKLIKYDAGMNVVKEVEIKMDMEAMKKSMEEMKKNCPMCSKKCDKTAEK